MQDRLNSLHRRSVGDTEARVLPSHSMVCCDCYEEGGISMSKKHRALAPFSRDPFALMRQMTSDFERLFAEPGWPSFGWPMFRTASGPHATAWFPEIDVFEKDNRLVTNIDLPGMKKEDVKVEVTDGHLAISGERKSKVQDHKENFYSCEREYGTFYRAVPLPQGVKLEDIKATFADGVLEVSVPLPAIAETKMRKVEIQEAPKAAAKTAA
jgi:HSP20 family protein